MKILKLEAENIKKLKVVEITPAGNIVEITGPNGSGKSSVLDSIFYALAGAKDIPTQPIRRGQLKAHVKLELGEITVIRKFSKDTGTSLVAEAKNGARFPTPQRLLDEMLGKLTFDPLEFSRMDPKKQLDQLRSMVKIDLDLDKLDADNASDFEKRTDLNREIKTLDARGFGFTFPDDTPDDEIDVSKLAQELEAAGQKNTTIQMKTAEKMTLEKSVEAERDAAFVCRSAKGSYISNKKNPIPAADRCATIYMRRERLEEHLDKIFATRLTDRGFLKAIVEQFEERANGKGSEKKVARLQTQLGRLDEKRARILDGYFDGKIVREERDSRLELVDRDRVLVVTALEEEVPSHPGIGVEQLVTLFRPLFTWKTLHLESKRRILFALVPEIKVADYVVAGMSLLVPPMGTETRKPPISDQGPILPRQSFGYDASRRRRAC